MNYESKLPRPVARLVRVRPKPRLHSFGRREQASKQASKQGDKRWYKTNIPLADTRFERSLIEAMGGELDVIARFPDQPPVRITQFRSLKGEFVQKDQPAGVKDRAKLS